jgi:hypothetical protein
VRSAKAGASGVAAAHCSSHSPTQRAYGCRASGERSTKQPSSSIVLTARGGAINLGSASQSSAIVVILPR